MRINRYIGHKAISLYVIIINLSWENSKLRNILEEKDTSHA